MATKYFTIFTIIIGIAYIILLPPFQSPDEPNHLVRIYRIAEGHLWGELSADKKEMGSYVPERIGDIFSPYLYLPFHRERKIASDTILKNLLVYKDLGELKFSALPNTARYAFTAYAPQAITTFLLTKLKTPQLLMLYVIRLVTFVFWLGLIIYAIKTTPIYKEWLMLLALLPTSMAINTTISADVVTNGLSFIVIALFFKFKFGEKPVFFKNILFFNMLMLFITWQKIVYFPLLFLLLLVSSNKLGGLRNKIIYFSFVIITNLAVVGWWSGEVNKLIYPTGDKYFTTYATMREDAQINPTLQIEHIKKDPLNFVSTFLETSFRSYDTTFEGYFSSCAWDGISIPNWLLYIFLIVFVLFLGIQSAGFTFWERLYLFALGHGMVMLFLLSQHLHWDGVGQTFEAGYAGKYYIPIYPIILLTLFGVFDKYFKSLTIRNSIKNILVLFVIVLHIDFLIIIAQRFYG